MVDMIPYRFQEGGFGIPSHSIVLYYTQLTCAMVDVAPNTQLKYTILYSAVVEMAPDPLHKGGFGIPSRYITSYYV